MTKKFFFGLQLLMHFQARHKTDSIPIGLFCLMQRNVSYVVFRFFVVGFWIEILFHTHVCFVRAVKINIKIVLSKKSWGFYLGLFICHLPTTISRLLIADFGLPIFLSIRACPPAGAGLSAHSPRAAFLPLC
jgi:hypothetical protein